MPVQQRLRAATMSADGESSLDQSTGREATGQSYDIGQFLKLVAGKLTECVTTNISSCGMAKQDAAGTLNTERDYVPWDDNQLVEMNVWYDGGGENDVTAVAQLQTNYGIRVAGNITMVALTDTTNVHVKIVEIITGPGLLYDGTNDYPGMLKIGQAYGRVRVKVLPSAFQA